MKNAAYAFLLFSFIYLVGCSKSSSPSTGPVVPTIAPPPAFGFYVVGYFPSYRDPATVPDVKFRMCNVVNYAFGAVNATGGITLASPTVLTALKIKAKANGAKVFISLNGTTTDWKNMASTQAGRTNYIHQAMDIVRNYGLDGVDVDWEFPSTSDGTDITYTALMKELSDSCHLNSKYYLTTALTSGKYVGGYTNAVQSILWTGNYVDFFNIMAYDDFNTTVPYKHHSDYTLATVCLNYWITTRGIPSTKVVLGLPAYGRASGITQTGTSLTYSGILGQGGSSQSDSATVTAGGYTNYKIYYNGQPTIKKKAMLAKNTAGGIMFWEHGQDTHDGSSLMKAACDTIGRPY
jgi:chitinase